MTLVLSSSIFAPAFVDAEVARRLDDEAYHRALLEVEAALARVEGRLGVIPSVAAKAISDASRVLPFDAPALAAGVLRDGIPITALVSLLRAAVPVEARPFVHFGVTSQDIMDTATVLCLTRALTLIEQGLGRLLRRLAQLAQEHRASVMVARTHGQQALPTTFGLTVALWASPLLRHAERLRELRPRLAVLQLGGAAGTLAALGPQAPAIAAALGAELGLGVPALPWHTQRDNLVEFAGWLSLLLGSLGKLAQDVILLCQSEVAELAEALPGARGGSSSMPQKNNPMRSEQILAAARTGSAQLSALHHALVQEHERGTHGWQVEWLCLSPLVLLAGGALQNAQSLARDLEVDRTRMRANLLAPPALAFAEAAVGALSAALPRPAAQSLLATCAGRARAENRALIDVLREQAPPSALDAVDWEALARPENHLGQALRWVDETENALVVAADEIESRLR
jgi:3-carboxy-cis,cis-muconate cycloisomerase